MSRIDQSALDLTDDVEKALEAWMRTRKAIRISSAWRAGVEWGRANPDSPVKTSEPRTPTPFQDFVNSLPETDPES